MARLAGRQPEEPCRPARTPRQRPLCAPVRRERSARRPTNGRRPRLSSWRRAATSPGGGGRRRIARTPMPHRRLAHRHGPRESVAQRTMACWRPPPPAYEAPPAHNRRRRARPAAPRSATSPALAGSKTPTTVLGGVRQRCRQRPLQSRQRLSAQAGMHRRQQEQRQPVPPRPGRGPGSPFHAPVSAAAAAATAPGSNATAPCTRCCSPSAPASRSAGERWTATRPEARPSEWRPRGCATVHRPALVPPR
mmetsp:Transcript_89756/g.192420  ORF Transcript_89756/g.192420 Transcript_89756/m.192420 type:complete len:250 (+) Transcript_89756:361-1110(+)